MENGEETAVQEKPKTEIYHVTRKGFQAGNKLGTNQDRKAQNRGKRKTPRIGPARWARARVMFIQGELSALVDVASWIGCGLSTVQHKSNSEHWLEQRKQWADKVTARLEDVAGLLKPEQSQEDLLEIGRIRSELARQAISFGKPIADTLASMNALLETAMRQPVSEQRTGYMADMVRLRSATLDDLCRLAGLPEPGRMSAKPSPSTVPAQAHDPASFQPVGLADEAGGGGS